MGEALDSHGIRIPESLDDAQGQMAKSLGISLVEFGENASRSRLGELIFVEKWAYLASASFDLY
jgi:hypothetical protein